MDVNNKYLLAYERLEQVIENRKAKNQLPALGYTSNLDLICDFDVDILNQLLQEHLPEIDVTDIELSQEITSRETLLKTIVYFCINGIGGEVDIEDGEILKDIFDWEYGIGGTAVQAARALSCINCPSIVHLTDDSREICKLLDTPYIYTVSESGRLIHTSQVSPEAEQEIHFIIQFKKGDIIELGNEEVEIPASNRLIITKVTVNETVPFSEPYFKYIEENAGNISSNVLSSFNVISDRNLLLKRLKYVKKHVEEYKENNSSGVVFFEDAHYHALEIKKLCSETIYPCADIVSLNEEELAYTLEIYGQQPDDDIISRVEGAKYIRDRFNIKRGIIVHTKDYSMYVGEEPEADIESGLIYGNLLATAKARNGWYGNKEQIAEVLDLKLSPRGLAARKRISESRFVDEVTLVPTKYIDSPRYTIGLGDTFVAGVQICF